MNFDAEAIVDLATT